MDKTKKYSKVSVKYIDHSSLDDVEATLFLIKLYRLLDLKIPNHIIETLKGIEDEEPPEEDERYTLSSKYFFEHVMDKEVQIESKSPKDFVCILEDNDYEITREEGFAIELSFKDEWIFNITPYEDGKFYYYYPNRK